jgi:hypothetical protein
MNITAEHYRVPNAGKPFEPESLGLAENFCAQPHDLLENGGAPVDIWMSTKMMVATEPDWIRSTIEKYREWIESVQGVPIERMAVLQVSNRFTSLAARKILRGVPLNKLHNGPTAKLRAAVTSIEYPKGMPPLIRADLHSKASAGSGDRQNQWDISWGDSPVAVRFKQLQGAIIALEMPHHEHDATCWSEIVICRQDEIALVMDMIRESNVSEDGALYSTGRSFKSVKSSSWDDLVLDEPVLQLLKSDYEPFFAREDWFRSLKLPFRRGYLLHGPPGNGKTSVIRAMLSRRGMRGLRMSRVHAEVQTQRRRGLVTVVRHVWSGECRHETRCRKQLGLCLALLIGAR